MTVEELDAVAAGVDHFQFALVVHEAVGEFEAGDLLRHDDVGEEQINFATGFFPDFKGFDAVAGEAHLVTVFLEKIGNETTDWFFVFDDKNGFFAAEGLGRRLFFLLFALGFTGGWKEDRER